MATIKAITLTQPWASLVAVGAKRVETRSWRPFASQLRPGDRIAIHAAKGWTAEDRHTCTTEPFRSAIRAAYRAGLFCYLPQPDMRLLPRGQVIALARYVRAVPGNAPEIDNLSEQERAFGYYGYGRWAWFLDDVRPIEPIAASGRLGLWDWEVPDWLTYLEPVPPSPLPAATPSVSTAELVPPQTRVVHVNRDRDFDIYIGRPMPRRPDLTPTGWGNPFRPPQAIERYRAWIETQPQLLARLSELRGKTLGCWCAPKGGLPGNSNGHICHGEVLAALADATVPVAQESEVTA